MQKKQKKYSIVWFTNNLRTQDNIVLHEAINSKNNIIAVYFFDPRHYAYTEYGFKKTDKFRAKFTIQSIIDLQDNLKNLNIPLFTYQNTPENILPILVEQFQVQSIYTQKEWTQQEVNVFEAVNKTFPDSVSIKTYCDQFLFHPEDVPIEIENIPNVFSTFRKIVEKKSIVRPTAKLEEICQNEIHNPTKIPTLQDLGFDNFEIHPNTAFPFSGGETQANKRLQDYFFNTKKLGFYKKTRNGLAGIDYSSKFSPWLANGSISARTIYWAIKEFETIHLKNQSTYWLIFELIWRDYFKYISLRYGNAIFKLKGILNKDYHWKTDENEVNKWIHGETNQPFVNANMIELKNTGWMSNRGRQNVASYFAKELNLDWRIGAAYFESLLLDYDVHSNYGNWMYVAGVGNDPRDRKFNVQRQADMYDPNHKFRNIWLQPTLF